MEKVLEKKSFRKGVVILCFIATIAGICYILVNPRTTRNKQDEVRQFVEPTKESQAKPETKTTTEDKKNKVEATQPKVESYNDSMTSSHESAGEEQFTTSNGSDSNKIVAEDNSKSVGEANEEIREAQDNGAVVVEDKVTGVTAVTETQPTPAAEEEEKETQKRVDLNFSTAIDATNEK